MKILHLSRTMGNGGAEKIVLQLSNGVKDFFDNTYVASTGGELVSILKEKGIYHLNIEDIESKNPITILSNIKTLYKTINENNISILHVHHRMGLLYAHILKIRFKNLKVIYTAHNIFLDKKMLYALLLKSVEIIAVGDGVKRTLPIKHKSNVKVIYNCVEPFQEQHIATELVNEKRVKILCAARLSEQKGHKYLIEAIKLLKDRKLHDKFHLYLLGSGEDEEKLKRLVKKQSLEKEITFLGYKENVMDYIHDCDFMVLPSLWEGFPLIPIECFMMQKTIIATDILGTSEIVNEQNGILVPPKNSDLLADAIIKLTSTPSFCKELSIQSKKDYEQKFSYVSFLENYKELYNKVKINDE